MPSSRKHAQNRRRPNLAESQFTFVWDKEKLLNQLIVMRVSRIQLRPTKMKKRNENYGARTNLFWLLIKYGTGLLCVCPVTQPLRLSFRWHANFSFIFVSGIKSRIRSLWKRPVHHTPHKWKEPNKIAQQRTITLAPTHAKWSIEHFIGRYRASYDS